MKGLAALLSGRAPAGVYRWDTDLTPQEIEHAVGLSDWTSAYVDGPSARTKADLLAALAERLGFPETFGHNLDALADSLRDLPAPTVVVWEDWSELARTDRSTFDLVVKVFAHRSTGGPPFAVLLRGPGPEVDLPQLTG